jgi:hypothetical protein
MISCNTVFRRRRLHPKDKRLAGEAAPMGTDDRPGLKAYPDVVRMARLSPPIGSLASLETQTCLAEPNPQFHAP